MKCDHCENEATVHEVNIVAGKKTEVHLCQQCGQELGVVPKSQANIADLLAKMVMNPAPSTASQTKPATACESCGTTFAEVRKKGLLGCSECYETFDQQLNVLLQRAHEGGTHHMGKVPRRVGGQIDREYQILRFRKQLQDAVCAEDYERAASLRDQLRQIGIEGSLSASSGDLSAGGDLAEECPP